MYWVIMMFSEEGHVRVPTLLNHMKQNNDFAKAFIRQYYLPEHQRQGFLFRLVRLGVYLLTMLATAGQICTFGFETYETAQNKRTLCLAGCEDLHFPLITCEITESVQIVEKGSEYNHFFRYQQPLIELSSAVAEQVEKRVNDACADFPGCSACRADATCSGEIDAALSDVTAKGYVTRASREALAARIGAAKAAETVRFVAQLRGWDIDRLPEPVALSGSRSACGWYALNQPAPVMHEQEEPKRAKKLLSCLSSCRRGVDAFEVDTRPLCSEEFGEGNEDFFIDMLCVDPDEPADIRPQLGFYTCEGNICISLVEVVLAIILGNAIQLFFEVTLYQMSELYEDPMDIAMTSGKCFVECMVVFYVAILIMVTVAPLLISLRIKVDKVVWDNFFVVLALDQLKNLTTQPLVWYLVVRRCNTLVPGIQEYNEEYVAQWDPMDSLVTSSRLRVKGILDLWRVRAGSIVLVILYAFFTIFVIIFLKEEEGTLLFGSYYDDVKRGCEHIDFVVVHIFFAELVLKFLAYGLAFVYPITQNMWEFVDAVVILVSMYFAYAEGGGVVAMLRLLRLLRVILILRKVSEGRAKLKNLQNQSAVSVGTVQAQVIEFLEELATQKALTAENKDELQYAIDMISRDKIYVVSLSTDAEDKAEKEAISTWLEQSGQDLVSKDDAAEESGMMMMRSKTQKPGEGRGGTATRNSLAKANRKHANRSGTDREEEIARQVRQFYEMNFITVTEEQHIEETLQDFDAWNFDAVAVNEMIGKIATQVIYCRMVAVYDLVQTISLDAEKLANFAKKIQSSFSPNVRFNGATRALDMIQAVHYFHVRGLGGGWSTYSSDRGTLALFTGALVAHCCNPGFTNDFLVKTRHPRALRYNDNAIILNYTLAFVSQTLREKDSNFLAQWSSSSVSRFRAMLIDMVLKLDITRHFPQLGELSAKLSTDQNFPNDIPAERNSMYAFSLRAANLAWCARPVSTFQKWSERHIEELFTQGDLEKQVGVLVSTFCDRDVVQPDKVELSILMIMTTPFLSAFALVFDNKNWPGAKELEKDVVNECENNRLHLMAKLSKEGFGS